MDVPVCNVCIMILSACTMHIAYDVWLATAGTHVCRAHRFEADWQPLQHCIRHTLHVLRTRTVLWP